MYNKIQKLFNVKIALWSGEVHGYREVKKENLDALVAKSFNAIGVKSVIVYDENYTQVVKKLEKSDDKNPDFQVDYRCAYCNKSVSKSEVIHSEIWENHSRKMKSFCSKIHASYYQMGAEG